VKLGIGASAANVWIDTEIEAYQKARIAERDAKLNSNEAA
jgi:hypothetical protein